VIDGSPSSTPSGHDAAERVDTPRVLDELSRSNAAPHARARSRSSGLRRFLILVVLLVPVLLALVWLVSAQLQTAAQVDALLAENAMLQQRLATAPSGIAQEQLSGLADRQALDALRSELDQRLAALAAEAATAASSRAAGAQRQAQDWLWTEAEYLLRLANQKLALQGDGDSALLILTTVDEMLRDSGDLGVLGVRDALAGEMLALRSMDYVDVSGLHARLNALLPLVEQLSLRDALVQNHTGRLALQQQQEVSTDAGFGTQALALLRSIFVWQRWDVPPEALLPPQQEAVLKQNLQVLLEQAQLALLMAQPEVYRIALQRGQDWVARYFALDTGAGRTLQQELQTLAEQRVAQTHPDISASLTLLQQANARRDAVAADDGR
jgi:uroporphyrin-3 C-methyltransferase